MSHNPATRSEISNNPSKNAVTAASSSQEQEADVARKLKLYGVIQALRDGRFPDNNQINETLDYAIRTSPVDLDKLSPDGKLLVEDVRDILETARMIIAEKNDGELFQNFAFSTRKGDPSRGAKSKSELMPADKKDFQQDASEAAAHLRTLITLFATNSEARKLLSDFGFVARDIFATGAAKVADKAKPSEQQLNQIDKSAPSGEWISADGQKVGKNTTPELQIKGPNGTEFRAHPKDDPRDARVTGTDGQTRSAGDAYSEAQDKKNQLQQQAQEKKEDARYQANQAQGEAQGRTGGIQGLKEQAKAHAEDIRTSGHPIDTAREKKNEAQYEAQNRKQEAKDRASSQYDQNTSSDAPGSVQEAKDRALNAIPDEHRERISRGIDSGRQIVHDALPQERRDQFIHRLKKVVVDCQDHKDYQEAISFFLDKAETYKGHAKHVTSHGTDSAAKVADDPAYNQASLQFRTLLERFANGQSMQPMWDAIDDMYTDSVNDQGLRNWYNRLNDYIHKVLLEPGYILDDESTREGEKIRDDGRQYFEHKYKGHFENLGNQTQTFFTAMGDDPLNQRFGEDWKRLTKDLLFDSEGNLSYKPRLLNDIRRVILPSVISNIGYVPIPRAEYSDDKIDLVIENLVLQGANLAPNVVEIASNNHFKFSPYDNIPDSQHHVITLGFSQIQADLRDVIFQFRRKSGWPKLKDAGVADVLIGGKGISVKVTLETNNRRDSTFSVKTIDTEIDTLKFSIRDSHHDLLYKFIKTTATGLIKKAIQAAMQVALRTALEHIDEQVTEVRNRMDQAKQSDETTRRDEFKNLYQRKKETAKHNAEKADEKTGTFKIVTDREDSIVPDIDAGKTKQSYTKRAFAVEDSIGNSNDWKSPIFSIVHSEKNHPAHTGVTHPATRASTDGRGLVNDARSAVSSNTNTTRY